MHGSFGRRRWRTVRAPVVLVAILLLLGLAACAGQASVSPRAPSARPAVSSTAAASDGAPGSGRPALRYVALGDSYTIGTSVTEPERWPNQLVGALATGAKPLDLVANLGVNGFTSADVIAVELPRLDDLKPDFVTLGIGVNDVVQGVPEAAYRERIGQILTALRARLPADRIVLVTTPDYTVTPAGADYGDPATKRAAIRRFNEILTQQARGVGIAVVDIFDISERVATDGTLVARDGLHPSGHQYGLWVEQVAPVTRTLLGTTGS